MTNELKKRTKSSKAIEERRVEEYLKLEQEHMEKERILELKEERREKTRQEIRDSLDKRSQLLFTRNYIRKKEQEKNMRKINKHLEYVRKSNIDRIKDSESGSRTRHEINFTRLRAQIELELRMAVNKNV